MEKHRQRTDDDRRVDMDARDWIVRLSSGHVGDDELARFKAWRDRSPAHRSAFERERLFWQQLHALEEQPDETAPMRAYRAPPRRAIGRRAFLIGAGTTAAAGAAFIGSPRLERWWRSDFSTGIGEQAEFALPDGSVAMLNTGSAISVDFSPGLRLVELLAGEAEFRVAHPSPGVFRVAALGGNSDALGTTFTVRAVDGLATITVADGQVRVTGPAAPTDVDTALHDRVDLSANEQTSYGAGEAPRPAQNVDTETELAWRGGRLIFEARPLASAIAELGRYIPERIVLGPGVSSQVPVTAIFSTSQALAALEALARTQGLTARRIPRVVVLIS